MTALEVLRAIAKSTCGLVAAVHETSGDACERELKASAKNSARVELKHRRIHLARKVSRSANCRPKCQETAACCT